MPYYWPPKQMNATIRRQHKSCCRCTFLGTYSTKLTVLLRAIHLLIPLRVHWYSHTHCWAIAQVSTLILAARKFRTSQALLGLRMTRTLLNLATLDLLEVQKT